MKLTVGYHFHESAADLQPFFAWVNTLNVDECELLIVDDRRQKDPVELLQNYPFSAHVKLKVISFPFEGKANAYNHMIYQARYPWLMFVTAQHRFDSADIHSMLQLASKSDADIVVAPIDPKQLPWHQRRMYPRAFDDAQTIFDVPSILASFTDTIYGKLFSTGFLTQNKVHFMEFDSMLGIPFLTIAYAYRAKVAYAHWLQLPLGDEVFEQGHKDILKALDRITQQFKRLHLDDLFEKELHYLILRKIIVNNLLISKELSKQERTLLIRQCKNYIKRRGIKWDNPYFTADDKWLRLNVYYAKMMIG